MYFFFLQSSVRLSSYARPCVVLGTLAWISWGFSLRKVQSRGLCHKSIEPRMSSLAHREMTSSTEMIKQFDVLKSERKKKEQNSFTASPMLNTSWDSFSAFEFQVTTQCYTKVDWWTLTGFQGGEWYGSELPHLFMEQTYLCGLQKKGNDSFL